jgi:excisionase family DNA binding protein
MVRARAAIILALRRRDAGVGERLGMNKPVNARSQPTSRSELDPVNTVEEVAAFAKVSRRTVMRAIAAGELDALRAGTRLRITEGAVWSWLNSEAQR